MSQFAPRPDPPYYAVIFASQQSTDTVGYARMAEKMAKLAESMPGYIGTESTRDSSGFGITVSQSVRPKTCLTAFGRTQCKI